ncbi:MAG TPA: hypothetical protein PJ991_13210 [Kiritimatiellia bacterium]|nr:hypothetical protein [Kiritimatiellia bacterium]
MVFRHLVILILLSGISAHARLGENEVACAMRYNHGKDVGETFSDRHYPLLSGPHANNRTYHFQGWRIRIGFARGIAHRVEYKHLEMNRKITGPELQAILEANGGINAWRREGEDTTPNLTAAPLPVSMFSEQLWIRNDGAHARLLPNSTTLILESAAYIRWKSAPSRKQEKPVPKF